MIKLNNSSEKPHDISILSDDQTLVVRINRLYYLYFKDQILDYTM